MIWLAERVKPTDKIVIAEELHIRKDDQRVIKLKQVYDFIKSEKFKKINQKDLINSTDGHILKKLQHSPEFVYEKADLVFNFFKTNKFKITSPEIIIRKGEEITEEWIADSFVNYVVGYDNKVVYDKFPFYDPQFREFHKEFSLSHIKPIKSFKMLPLQKKLFSKEPEVNIYVFDA